MLGYLFKDVVIIKAGKIIEVNTRLSEENIIP
jgi:hypothetical protein